MDDRHLEELSEEEEPAEHPWQGYRHLVMAACVWPELAWGSREVDGRLYSYLVHKLPDEALRWELGDETSEASQRMQELVEHQTEVARRKQTKWSERFDRYVEEEQERIQRAIAPDVARILALPEEQRLGALLESEQAREKDQNEE